MNLKELFTEDRGVSPVIGVILMVAITVILAAVIGAFVLGLGDQASQSAPQASFAFNFENDDNATITHSGGDNIANSTIEVTIDGEEPNSFESWGTDTISTGDSYRITNQGADGGETIRVIWENPAGGSSNILAERDWP